MSVRVEAAASSCSRTSGGRETGAHLFRDGCVGVVRAGYVWEVCLGDCSENLVVKFVCYAIVMGSQIENY